ncbi:hypothetical protein WAE58_20775 [Pedobacter panaciterrae]|uniref:ZU5 domain-containing protein n=1 Tax=Pedobacter panaciterrae TaxID=363849 RepID=A0ABU8NTU8_9SPHI|nr:hypothetical protein [uncultured Pedobacter sp.]
MLVLVVAIISCKKKPHIEPEPDPEVVIPGAVKTPHAELVGTAVSQTIGAAGGTLTVPNSQLKLVIPPGAVDKDINFSVQEVKTTLPNGGVSSDTYRFLPEDVQFQKDVQIVMPFKYENHMAIGTIRPIYQDKHGYWHVVKNGILNRSEETITANTRHFSDWSSIPLYYIEITGKKRLEKGESTTLTVKHWPTLPSGNPGDDDDMLAPEGEISSKLVKEWRLYGTGGTENRGTVTRGESTSATFTAPSTYPPYQRVTGIEAVVKGVDGWQDQNLQIYVDRLAENYCYALVDGTSTDSFGVGGINVAPGDGMSVTFTSHNSTRISINAPKNTFGKYDFNEGTWVSFSYFLGNYFSTTYTDCIPAGNLFTKGDIVVIENKNGLITGNIEGVIRMREKTSSGNYCWIKSVPIEVDFRYKAK